MPGHISHAGDKRCTTAQRRTVTDTDRPRHGDAVAVWEAANTSRMLDALQRPLRAPGFGACSALGRVHERDRPREGPPDGPSKRNALQRTNFYLISIGLTTFPPKKCYRGGSTQVVTSAGLFTFCSHALCVSRSSKLCNPSLLLCTSSFSNSNSSSGCRIETVPVGSSSRHAAFFKTSTVTPGTPIAVSSFTTSVLVGAATAASAAAALVRADREARRGPCAHAVTTAFSNGVRVA